jgi:putative membrane protein
MKIVIVLLLAALLSASPVRAADTGPRDAQIAGILTAANQGEIDAAALAAAKAQNAEVKKFAAHMTHDHTDARQKLIDVERKSNIAPIESEESKALAGHAAEEASGLGDQTGAAFDRAYMDAQVADHAALLKTMDEELIPGAKDPALAALLRKLKPTVARHLSLAKRLQAQLEGRKP